MPQYPTKNSALASGSYHVECRDSTGALKWELTTPNLVVNTGICYLCGAGLTGTTPISAWYLGLYGAAATNNPAAGDTSASHPGWVEITPYADATRPICVFSAATLANPSVATNTASKALILISTAATVGGAFLSSDSTKSGSSGILFSAADFGSPGDRTVVAGDILSLTYTFSLTAT